MFGVKFGLILSTVEEEEEEEKAKLSSLLYSVKWIPVNMISSFLLIIFISRI
jgi:hypothetical protein